VANDLKCVDGLRYRVEGAVVVLTGAEVELDPVAVVRAIPSVMGSNAWCLPPPRRLACLVRQVRVSLEVTRGVLAVRQREAFDGELVEAGDLSVVVVGSHAQEPVQSRHAQAQAALQREAMTAAVETAAVMLDADPDISGAEVLRRQETLAAPDMKN